MTLNLFLIEVATEMRFKLVWGFVFFVCVKLEHKAHKGEHSVFTILIASFD